MEEQRRLEKERNFQLQQERLKQFTVGSKKSSINADNLIDSMFGKFQPKRNVFAVTSGRSGASRTVVSTKNAGRVICIYYRFLKCLKYMDTDTQIRSCTRAY